MRLISASLAALFVLASLLSGCSRETAAAPTPAPTRTANPANTPATPSGAGTVAIPTASPSPTAPTLPLTIPQVLQAFRAQGLRAPETSAHTGDPLPTGAIADWRAPGDDPALYLYAFSSPQGAATYAQAFQGNTVKAFAQRNIVLIYSTSETTAVQPYLTVLAALR